MVGRRSRPSLGGDDEGRRLTCTGEHVDFSDSRMRVRVFVAVLGIDAVERIEIGIKRVTSRRADDHPQLVPRAEEERSRP